MARPSDDHRSGMAVTRPDGRHADSDAWLGRLVGVDGSGGASTAGNRDNTAKAILAGFTNGLGSGPPNLLEAYARWKAAQKAAPSPADPEAVAMRKSRKKLARSLREGASPAAAVVAAHARYKKHGGRSSLAVWARRVAQG
jgi:hypothetical protein